MTAVFYDGELFPDKKTFERTAYNEAVLLRNGEILGYRDKSIFLYIKGTEKKFAACFHLRSDTKLT